MTHGLLSAVRALRRQTQVRLFIDAMARWLNAVLLLIAVACIIDYLWRPGDPIGRWFLSVSVWLGGWAAYRHWLRPALRLRISDVQFARWIERVDSSWGDRLSSAVGFLSVSADEPRYGSSRLRSVLIDMVQQSADRLRSSYYLSSRRTLRSLVALGAVALCLAGLAVWRPLHTGLAFQRVVMPWSSLAWPRRHVLELLDLPKKVVRGHDVDIIAVDRQGRLPAAVTLFYQAEGDQSPRALPMQYAGGKMIYRLQNVTKPFSVRVAGGDDDAMPWQMVDVVPPPHIERCLLGVKPPGYSGYKAYELTGVGPVLHGSSVEWRLSVQPAASQVFMHVDGPGTLGLPEDLLPLVADVLDSTGRHFRVSNDKMRAAESGRYWFEIHYGDGVRWQSPAMEFRVVADRPPTVRLEPINRTGLVTRKARLRVRGQADDDLGVRRVVIRLHAGSGSAEMAQSIWESDEPPRHDGLPPPSQADIRRFDSAVELGTWDFSEAAQEVAIQVTVEDFAGQTGASEPVSLRLVTEREFAIQLVQLHGQLLPQLEEAIRLQRMTQQKAQQVGGWLAEGSTLAGEHVDLWKSAEAHQRRVTRLLTDESSGLAPRVAIMLEELSANGLDVPDLERALELFQAGLARVQPWLIRIEASMTEVTRQLPEPPSFAPRPETRPGPHVEAAIQGQTNVLAELEALRDAAAQWEGYRQFAGRLQEVAAEQNQLADQSAAVQAQWLGRSLSELSAGQRSELRRLAQQQDALGRRLEQLVRQMQAALPRLQVQNEQAAAGVRRALQAIDRHAVTASMRSAAQDVQNNRMGQATENQRKASQGLAAALQAIAGSGRDDQRQKLAELAKELDSLLRRQEQLDGRRAEVAAAPHLQAVQHLADQQQQLARATDETANATADAQPVVSQLIGEAGRSMRELAERTAGRQWQAADQLAQQARQALHEATELVRSGQQLLRQESQSRQQHQLQLWFVQWHKAQTAIATQTRELEEWRKQQSVWTSEQRRAVESLATRQFRLAQQLQQATHELEGFPVVRFQLGNLERLMEEASVRLGRFDAGEQTQSLQLHAAALLAQLQEAFAHDEADESAPGKAQAAAAPDAAGQGSMPQGPVVSMQELRLLELMQEELRQRTQALQQQRQAEAAAAQDQWLNQSRRLAEDQLRLAQLLADLFAGGESVPEHKP